MNWTLVVRAHLRLLQLKLGFCVDRLTIVGSEGTANLPALSYLYYIVIVTYIHICICFDSVSEQSALPGRHRQVYGIVKQVGGPWCRERSAGPRHREVSRMSTWHRWRQRSTASVSDREVQGIDEQSHINQSGPQS